jgi:hypothetical protein
VVFYFAPEHIDLRSSSYPTRMVSENHQVQTSRQHREGGSVVNLANLVSLSSDLHSNGNVKDNIRLDALYGKYRRVFCWEYPRTRGPHDACGEASVIIHLPASIRRREVSVIRRVSTAVWVPASLDLQRPEMGIFRCGMPRDSSEEPGIRRVRINLLCLPGFNSHFLFHFPLTYPRYHHPIPL